MVQNYNYQLLEEKGINDTQANSEKHLGLVSTYSICICGNNIKPHKC